MNLESRGINGITIDARARKDTGDIAALARSIHRVGLLHPPVVTPDGKLIAGLRRLEALKHLGWTEIPVTVVSNLDDALLALQAERDENTERKELTLEEAVRLAARIEPLERTAAKVRQAAAGPKSGRGRKTGCGDSPQPVAGRTRDRVAKAVNMDAQRLNRAKEIVRAADAEPEKYGDILKEMNRTNRVSGVYRKLVCRRLAEDIRREPPPLPDGPFRVIVIDPPWPYQARKEDASHRGQNPYPDMSVDEIAALPVEQLSGTDCALWLWTTNAFVHDAFHLLEKWNFTHKTILVWDKQVLGMGDYLRNVTELCILAVKGHPTLTLTNQTTLISERRSEHSRKPDAFYALVEALCPGAKLEMFARRVRPSWTVWGAETDSANDIPIPGENVPEVYNVLQP